MSFKSEYPGYSFLIKRFVVLALSFVIAIVLFECTSKHDKKMPTLSEKLRNEEPRSCERCHERKR